MKFKVGQAIIERQADAKPRRVAAVVPGPLWYYETIGLTSKRRSVIDFKNEHRYYVLNPGAAESLAWGCTCPVLDNCHGKFAPHPLDGWWITQDCPLHDLDIPDKSA